MNNNMQGFHSTRIAILFNQIKIGLVNHSAEEVLKVVQMIQFELHVAVLYAIMDATLWSWLDYWFIRD